MQRYLSFFRQEYRFLLFGLLLTCFSSYGQTFFIALFNDYIREFFALSHQDFGLVYSLATLASGFSLVWLGRQLDRLDLRLFTALVLAGLLLAALLFSAAQTVVLLAVAVFALRLCGQGLMGHIAMTSMARYFNDRRGTALAIAAMGFPIGTALFPGAAVFAVEWVGWRAGWQIFGASVLALIPLVLWLLRGHGERHRALLAKESAAEAQEATAPGHEQVQRHWTRRQVAGDPRFYLALLAVLAPPFLATGIMFHQVHLAEVKGWDIAWLTLCYPGFAVSHVASSLLFGPLVDTFTARRLLPFYLPPMALGIVSLTLGEDKLLALLFFVLTGLTIGGSGTIVGALWAEVYGVRYLGSIRALVSALTVCSTAVSPFLFGCFIDAGVSFDAINTAAGVYTLAAAVAAGLAYRAGR